MKVEKVIIKEFKVLENFEEEIKGNHVLIMGDNGVGKSTLIQFMEIALGKQTSIPPNASGSGELFVNKDGKTYNFGVKFKDGKPVITVTSPDGLKDTRKGTIAGIVGAIDFDIDEFVELSKSVAGRKKQIEIFKSFLPQEIKDELARHEQNIKSKYDERTDANRIIKEKEGFVKSHELYPVIGVKQFKHTEIKDVIAKLKSMNEHNSKVLEVVKRFNDRDAEIKEAVKKIAELQKFIEDNSILQDKASEWLKENKEFKPVELLEVENELDTVEKSNKEYLDSILLQNEIDFVEKLKEEVGEMTAEIDSSKEAVANAIRDMDGPIEGLCYDDDTLIYNGIPVNPDSLSTSEIMELGMRLKMAENEGFGILFLQRAESIGTERFKKMIEIANKAGWQIIAEQVERGNNKLHVEIMTDDLISK